MRAGAKVRQAAVRVQVRRADGRVEDLGVVSYFHGNPVRRALFAAGRWWGTLGARRRALLARPGARRALFGWFKPSWIGPRWGRFGAGKER